MLISSFFFFNDTAPPEIYTLSLHDALPISVEQPWADRRERPDGVVATMAAGPDVQAAWEHAGRPGVLALLSDDPDPVDRKSTRLNSSHPSISYAVFCLKKKKKKKKK